MYEDGALFDEISDNKQKPYSARKRVINWIAWKNWIRFRKLVYWSMNKFHSATIHFITNLHQNCGNRVRESINGIVMCMRLDFEWHRGNFSLWFVARVNAIHLISETIIICAQVLCDRNACAVWPIIVSFYFVICKWKEREEVADNEFIFWCKEQCRIEH